MAVRIGELLLKEKKITPTQLQEALGYQKSNGGKLAMNLVKLGFVRDEEITALLSRQYGVPSIDLGKFEIDATTAEAYTALASAANYYDYDWVRADEGFRRALELNPNSSVTHDLYGVNYLSPMGRHEEAFAHGMRL